ncbi:putative membrane protein [Brucella vulpis]|nr:putative membrane protein [Brucella vulpis]CUW51812.1 putative membrane protein [Brucella vulpis]
MNLFLQIVINGILLGGLYAIMAHRASLWSGAC